MPDRPLWNEKRRVQLGYRMPAEWEPHEATWLAWPHNPEDWPGKFQSIPWLYAEIVRLLAAHERVHLIVENAATQKRVTSACSSRAGANLDQVSFHAGPPIAAGRATPARFSCATAKAASRLTNWRFNGWAKYSDWHLDDKLPGRVAKLLGAACVAACSSKTENGAKSRRPRRRLDRRQRRGITAHHRRVPAERGAAAQSRRQPRATGARLPRLSRHRPDHLARPRHRRRRYPRPRRRHRALRRARDHCHRRRAGHARPQPRAAG